MNSIAVDLYCGLGGWAEGFLSEGYEVIGFDIERHDYGTGGYPGQLVLQDVCTLHGSQFKDAAVIVASPPCQKYSYMAMPWKRAKALAAWYREDPERQVELNALFNACFRIQREASAAAGRHIPMIVENVRGAEAWVGSAAWHFGSYYLWGDVPALMPPTLRASKVPGFRFDGSGKSFQSESVKTTAHLNIRDGHSHTRHLTNQREHLKWGDCNGERFDERPKGNVAAHREGTKVPGIKLSEVGFNVAVARTIDPSTKPESFVRDEEMKRQHLGFSRKAASAQIAKIPFPLARHIAKCFRVPESTSRTSSQETVL